MPGAEASSWYLPGVRFVNEKLPFSSDCVVFAAPAESRSVTCAPATLAPVWSAIVPCKVAFCAVADHESVTMPMKHQQNRRAVRGLNHILGNDLISKFNCAVYFQPEYKLWHLDLKET